MSPYCHNPPLGTRPKAKIRIRTSYAAATCGSVTKIACKMSEMPPTRRWRTSNRFFAYFGPSKWSARTEQQYFVRLSDQRYARIEFKIRTGAENYFVIASYLNPTPGNRNLEFNPSEVIRSP